MLHLNQTDPVVPTDGYVPLPCWPPGGFNCLQARVREPGRVFICQLYVPHRPHSTVQLTGL